MKLSILNDFVKKIWNQSNCVCLNTKKERKENIRELGYIAL